VALTQWLKQLIHGRALAKTQAEHHQDPFVRRQHAKLMTHLDSQIEAVEKQIEALLEQDAALQQRVDCLDEIQGVGPRTASLVLAHMPELGRLNVRGKAGAVYAGGCGLVKWEDEKRS
jgi:transposase